MIEPFDYANSWLTTFRFRAIGVGCTILATAIGVGAVVAEKPWTKTLLFSSALGMTVAARVAEEGRVTNERIGLDYTDLSDNARQGQVYRQLTNVEEGPLLALEDIATEPDGDEAPWYDLTQAAKECHLAVVGSTGSGKSVLTQWLLTTVFPADAAITAYDTDAGPSDWKGIKVVGKKGDVGMITLGMFADIDELQERTVRRAEGQEIGHDIVRVVEEFPSLRAAIADDLEKGEGNTALTWLKKMLRRGRKYNMSAVLVAQEFEVKALGLDGEGSVRKGFTIIFLGKTAIAQLDSVRDQKMRSKLRTGLKEMVRPCLVEADGVYHLAEIPDLSAFAAQIEALPSRTPDVPADVPQSTEPEDQSPAMPAVKSEGRTMVIKATAPAPVPDDITLSSGKTISGGNLAWLHQQAIACKGDGLTKTNIIKDVWKMTGRNYTDGKELWAALEGQFGEV